MSESFYEAVLPAQGQFCLVLLPDGKHLWTDTTAKLAKLAERYKDRTQVYIGTAAFETRANRTQANVLALRSLRLDIDAGEYKYARDPNGTYIDQRAALAAFVAFTKATKLAPSFILSSGHGLHIYYALDQDLSPDDWLPLANGLKDKCLEHELKVDRSVTCDTARILRPIGGLHSDDLRVSVLKETGVVHSVESLSVLLGAVKRRKYDLSVNEDFKRDVVSVPSSARKIAKHCAALTEVADAAGDVPEPFWRAMLGLVKHTVEGDELAHEWSQGYSGYRQHATQAKLDAWTTGPSTCSEFGKHTTACGGCKHNGTIKSPIVLGRLSIEQVEALPPEKKPPPPAVVPAPGKPWDGHIPAGFFVKSANGVDTLMHATKVEKENEDGEPFEKPVEVRITTEIFWFSHWADSVNSLGAMITANKWDAMDQMVRRFEIPTSVIASRADMAKRLADFGVQTTTDKRAHVSLEHYMKAQYQSIKDLKRQVRVNDRFGLRILDTGELVSVHGNYILRGDGTIEVGMIGPALETQANVFKLPLKPTPGGRWPASVWADNIEPAAAAHVEFFKKHYGAQGMGKYQLAIMLGLASPFMAFVTGGYTSGVTLPANGLSVSLYEKEGGTGKTTVMKAVCSAYGNADDMTKDQNDAGSSGLGRIAKLAMWGTMPIGFDEMGRIGEKTASDLISSVANGSGREVMTVTGGLRSGSKWALMCLFGTNKSHREMVTINEAESAAVQYRMLELDMSGAPEFNADARDAFAADWALVKRDYEGCLGALIQREICKMGAVAMSELVTKCVSKAGRVVESDKEERFQYRALGAMLALHLVLTKLGLAIFDIKSLVDEFKRNNDVAKQYIKENALPTDGLELLERMIHDIRSMTLVTEEGGHRKGPVHMHRYAVHIGSSLPPKVEARYIKDHMTLYVSQEAVRTWCKTHKVREADIMSPAKEAEVLVRCYKSSINTRLADKFNLYRGMRESTNNMVTCYAFNIAKLVRHVGPHLGDSLNEDNVVPIRPAEDAA